MQTKKEIEDWYTKPDPWDYERNPDDSLRKEKILEALKPYGKFKRALDIGAGEGWITKDLPAETIHAIEWSDQAASRLPQGVQRVTWPIGKYDLVICTGCLYPQYDYQEMIDWIKTSSSGVILISSIKDWEVDLSELGKPVFAMEFPYRKYTQSLKIYEVGS